MEFRAKPSGCKYLSKRDQEAIRFCMNYFRENPTELSCTLYEVLEDGTEQIVGNVPNPEFEKLEENVVRLMSIYTHFKKKGGLIVTGKQIGRAHV